MIGMDSYMNTYLDRRMKNLIQDYDLATENDLGDFQSRLKSVEEAVMEIESFETGAETMLNSLEERLKKLKEARK